MEEEEKRSGGEEVRWEKQERRGVGRGGERGRRRRRIDMRRGGVKRGEGIGGETSWGNGGGHCHLMHTVWPFDN